MENREKEIWISLSATAFVSFLLVFCGAFAAFVYLHAKGGQEAKPPALGASAVFAGREGVCGSPFSFEKDRASLYVLEGEFNGEKTRFLFDTGASRTSVPLALAARQVGFSGKGLKTELVITAAGDVQGLILEGQSIKIGGHLLKTDVLAIPGSGEAILGMDVIRLFRVNLNGDGLVLTRDC